MSVVEVCLPLDVVNDLRVYAEALSKVENWRPEAHGCQVLRQVQEAIATGGNQHEPRGAMSVGRGHTDGH